MSILFQYVSRQKDIVMQSVTTAPTKRKSLALKLWKICNHSVAMKFWVGDIFNMGTTHAAINKLIVHEHDCTHCIVFVRYWSNWTAEDFIRLVILTERLFAGVYIHTHNNLFLPKFVLTDHLSPALIKPFLVHVITKTWILSTISIGLTMIHFNFPLVS
mgnify:CR=1 FL=1